MSFPSQLSLSASRIALLAPRLRPLAWALLGACRYRLGLYLTITQGWRSAADQAALWAQGRTTPGPVVTWAEPGQSLHERGLAFDVAKLHADGQVTWDDVPWEAVGSIGEELGLVWGGRWKEHPDRPHFELPPATGRIETT